MMQIVYLFVYVNHLLLLQIIISYDNWENTRKYNYSTMYINMFITVIPLTIIFPHNHFQIMITIINIYNKYA